MPEKIRVRVDGRQLTLTNLGKVLYPEAGFTKAEVIDYYTRVAPFLLPHIAGRALTVKRYPEGVDGPFFFEKNRPAHTPAWVRTARLPAPGSTKGRETIEYAVVDDLPTLVYFAGLAALELHTPMWRVDDEGRPQPPDTMVFDLDPGAPATIVECRRVALRLREALGEDGLDGRPKTSGNKGMQVYVPWSHREEDPSAYARALARRLEKERPDEVVSLMARKLRPGKVFIDWSQNNPAKTTVAPYSLRANPVPTVSTPLTWEEVEELRTPQEYVFTAPDVLERVGRFGDLMAPPERGPDTGGP
ncbi:ATP-dependent DNA ligase [Sphaerisporangium krabiense]|uniref:Bifunctional non-homologous end joining protein LigD n=1 Tax=Sphaerisporangium krabiense TaxID=763782 RepID=A0A7W8Z542_9ACTN|nr:non-homologous end-joining DNA ligase [Sphaerisporangium krabiense]MBB5627560.1 bifunctional non-homologous end joining protein LigD [Sphaerisporangium krabiense]GII66575.1 ATP-dependent DNA ligase [Sphaerisporangium krabiense]